MHVNQKPFVQHKPDDDSLLHQLLQQPPSSPEDEGHNGVSAAEQTTASDTNEDENAPAWISEEDIPVIRIQPSRGWVSLKLHEVWEYRELLYFLAWRDVKVRYKQTVLGASWAILQPFLSMVVFSIVFGRVARLPSDGIPYPIFSYAALVPWTFFANGITKSTQSLVTGGNMIKKIYFPRLVMPISAVLSGLIDFVLAFVVLLGMMLYFGTVPTLNIIWLPLLLLLGLVTSLGVGMWLTAMNVQFRDIRYVVPFLVQLWMYASPVVYPSSMFGEPWRTIYALNPMVGVIEGFRWALLGVETQPGPVIIVSALAAVALMVSGMFYFRRLERSFADVV
jgi:lipopolysaccharide transport system permease protein